jgi:hypothetical protein
MESPIGIASIGETVSNTEELQDYQNRLCIYGLLGEEWFDNAPSEIA